MQTGVVKTCFIAGYDGVDTAMFRSGSLDSVLESSMLEKRASSRTLRFTGATSHQSSVLSNVDNFQSIADNTLECYFDRLKI